MTFNREFRRKHLKGLSSEKIEDIAGRQAEQVLGDALLVIVDILDNNWKDIAKKETRMQNFGRLFKYKYFKQSIVHDTKYLYLLEKADLRRIKYEER